MQKNIVKPSRLRKGGVIGIVSPSSPLRDSLRLEKGIRYLESCGYRVEVAPHVYQATHYLAGSDMQRQTDIENMFANKHINAIMCSRGGYGTQRFLPTLNYARIKKHPKIFVGFSDITALQAALWRKIGLITFSGAMVGVDMDSFDAESEEWFWRVLTSAHRIGRVTQSLPITPVNLLQRFRSVHGHLICGNLTLLASLVGTPYSPDYTNSILLTEDIGEEPYRIDRYWQQLLHSRAVTRSSALLFGQYTEDMHRKTSTPRRPVHEICTEIAIGNNKPALANIMYGHTRKKLTLPFGVQCAVNSTKGTWTILESGVV